jgi:demethylmenaquinone methyltransferase / 2-methoxy-6-polyprenyl-1,4-benzoquinol methylase
MQSYQGPNPEKIRGMFSEIAGRYDLANTVLSGGIHHLWRKALVRWSFAREGQSVLDCASGTGDLAIEFKRAVGDGRVVGTDFCAEMLEPAPAKAEREGFGIKFEVADVTNLPYSNGTFDISSISFGIRNVGDPVKGLSELARVTRSGGVVMVLEFGQPRFPVFAQAYNFYSKKLLPKIGGWVTGNPQAYSYLQNSSAEFPCGDAFTKMMESTGQYSKVEWQPLSFGIAYMYKGTVR